MHVWDGGNTCDKFFWIFFLSIIADRASALVPGIQHDFKHWYFFTFGTRPHLFKFLFSVSNARIERINSVSLYPLVSINVWTKCIYIYLEDLSWPDLCFKFFYLIRKKKNCNKIEKILVINLKKEKYCRCNSIILTTRQLPPKMQIYSSRVQI